MPDNAEFVVEPTPVAGQSSGDASSIRANDNPDHREKAIGDAAWQDDHTEVLTDLDTMDIGQVLFTDMNGHEHHIQQFPYIIGRTSDCDLVLEGRGISRRHVEVNYQSGRFIINDLKSLNGIRVNGFKVTRVILEGGDEIKIGDVTLNFAYANGDSDQHEESNDDVEKLDSGIGNLKPKLKLAGIAAVTIVVVMGAWFGFQNFVDGNKPASDSTSFAKVVAPKSKDSNNPSSLGPAVAAPLATKMDEPVAFAFDVESSSSMVSVSKPEFVEPLAKPVKAKTIAKNTVTKPPKARGADKKAATILASSDKKYLRGEAPSVIKELKGAQKLKGLSKASASKLIRKQKQIEGLYAAYKKGNKTFRSGSKEDGFAQWTAFLIKEKKAFKSKRRSVYSIEVASRVMQEFVDQGAAARANGHHHEAYSLWKKALEVGDSIEAKVALNSVELKSKQLYRKGLRLEYVNSRKAREAWELVVNMVPPGTEYYTKANSKIAWYTQWSVE